LDVDPRVATIVGAEELVGRVRRIDTDDDLAGGLDLGRELRDQGRVGRASQVAQPGRVAEVTRLASTPP